MGSVCLSRVSLKLVVQLADAWLGLEAARHIVRLECARLILAVRNIEKGEAARQDIERTTGRVGVIQVWQLDMDNFQSVKSFAERVESELERLDVALLNAGVVSRTFKLSPEGWEETLQVNVLATALLALLLLPKLRASKTPSSTPRLGIGTLRFPHAMWIRLLDNINLRPFQWDPVDIC